MYTPHDPAVALFLSDHNPEPPLALTIFTLALSVALMAMLAQGVFG